MIDARTDRNTDRQEFRARCSCTWQGPWRTSHHGALADWHDHLHTIHTTDRSTP